MMQNLSMGGSRFPRTLILAALLGLLAVSCGNPPSVAPEKAPDRRSLQDEQQRFGTASLILPSGRSFPIKLVFSAEEHTKGLSGVRPEDFPDDMGMFFWFSQSGPRRFWMPDTWFDLDIIFLDENLTIVHVAKNMKAHPGRQTPPPIAMTPVIFARHVLEVKANGPLSRELQEGARLQWRAPHSLREIESNIHLFFRSQARRLGGKERTPTGASGTSIHPGLCWGSHRSPQPTRL